MEKYEIFRKADLDAIRRLMHQFLYDPVCITNTIFNTLKNDYEDIIKRKKILDLMLSSSSFMLRNYAALDPPGSSLDTHVHPELLDYLIERNAIGPRTLNKGFRQSSLHEVQMEDYTIFINGKITPVRQISTVYDPKCLKYTIMGTMNNEADDIKRRQKIISHILKSNPVILDTYLHQLDPESPLLEEKVHVDLLLHLMKNNANIRLADKNCWNLIMVALRSLMSASDMHKLCSYLINERKAYDLFSNNPGVWISPVAGMLFVKNAVMASTLEMIFDIHGFNIDQTCEMKLENERFELTLFQFANLGDQGIEIYRMMIGKGADFKKSFPANATVMMCAAEEGNLEAVKYYASLRLSINDKDESGATPVHYGCCNLEIMEYFISKNADLYVFDKEGDSPFHWSARLAEDTEFEKLGKYFKKHADDLFFEKNKKGETPLDIRRNEHPLHYFKILFVKNL